MESYDKLHPEKTRHIEELQFTRENKCQQGSPASGDILENILAGEGVDLICYQILQVIFILISSTSHHTNTRLLVRIELIAIMNFVEICPLNTAS